MTTIYKKRKHPLSTGKIINAFRKIHRITAAYLIIVILIISITGILLGWKNYSGGILLAKSYEGTSTDFKNWISIDSLNKIASKILHDSVSPDLSSELDRIDIRQDKGMIKFIFIEGYWAIQLDGASGKLLYIEKRRADFIENIHDGSILDYYLGTGDVFKLLITSISGMALLVFSITGFWLWYGPKRLRKLKLKATQKKLLRRQRMSERNNPAGQPLK